MSDEQGYNLKSRPGVHLRLLESIVGNANDAILVTEAEPIDKPGPRIVFTNESFTRTTGYATEEVIGKTPRILQGPKTDRKQLDKIRSALSKDESIRVELLNYRKNGTEFWVQINIVPIADEHGQTTHYVSIQRDITERKTTEQELRRTSRELVTIFESITDAFFFLDREWRFTYLNTEAERVLNRKRDGLIGKSIWDEFPEAVGLKFYQEYNRAVHEQRTVEFEEIYPSLETWFEVKAYPSETGLSVYFRDISERKRMEKELKEGEERLRTILVQYASDIITILEADGTIRYESPEVEKVLGYRPEELVGENIVDYIHPEDVRWAVTELATVQSPSEVRGPVEIRFRHKDGSWRYLEGIGNNLLDDPDVEGIVINSRDITARKLAEENYLALFENAVEGIYRTGPDGKLVSVNPALARVFGYDSPEEMIAALEDVQSNYVDPELQEEFARVMRETGRVSGFEYRAYRKDGSIAWVSDSAQVVRNEESGLPYYEGFIQDITERKLAEEEVKESLDLLQSVMEGTTDTVFVKDLQGRYLMINQAGAEALGKSAEEVVGKDDTELFVPEDGREAIEADREIMTTGEVRTTEDTMTAEGQTRTFFATKGPYRDSEGNVAGMFGVARDITDRKSAEEALRRSEGSLAAAQRMAHVGNWEWIVGEGLYWSDELYRIYGFAPQQFVPTYEDFIKAIHPEDRDYIERTQEEVRRSKEQPTIECRIVRPDGEVRIVQNFFEMNYDETGNLTRIAGTVQDITERKWEERRQRAQHNVTRILAEASTLEDAALEILRAICEILKWEVGGFWNVDRGAGVLRCIQTWNVPTIDVSEFIEVTRKTIFSRGEGLLGRIWESGEPAWIPDAWDAGNFPRMPVAVREGLYGGFGFPVFLEGKVLGVIDFFSREVRQPDREVLDMMAAIGSQVGQFIQRKSFEEQLQHQALHDDLTDLPNRTLFTDRLRHALERVKRRKKSVAVLFLDLDNFKYVNDTLGHDIGDRLLVSSAERLKECLRPEDTAARLGGDEFAVLLEELEEPSEAERVAKRILHALGSPFELEGHRQFTSASVGIVTKRGSDSSPGDLLRSADLAMYKAKAAGKNRYAIFDPETARRSMERLELENDLRSALERDEFKVHYQPLVLLRTGQVVGVEALARWEHPRRGLVTPCEFIPVAEEIGLIVHIGVWVLREACHQVRRWQESYLYSPPLIVSVNLSVRQLQNDDIVRSVEKTLRETGLEPESLTLEVTESAFVEDAEDHIATLRRLRGLGIRLAIDDFGVGYSSLSYLRRLPAGLLKIDGSFVERVTETAEDEILLRGAIDIAHGLGLRVAAEGVETAEQVALLESLGCDLAQGRYFSDALPAEETEALLAEYAPLS